MAASFRDIAPRPQDLAEAFANQRPADIATRPSRVAIACSACRTRRIKVASSRRHIADSVETNAQQCDGTKPTCRSCIERDTTCEYDPPTGPLLAQAQKRKIEELENDKTSLYEILWYLQTTSPDKATSLLQHMRTSQGKDMGAILENFEQGRGQGEPAAEPYAFPNDSPSAESTPSVIVTIPEIMDHPRLSSVRKGQTEVTGIAMLSRTQESATVDGLHGSLEMFHNCVGALFYIMNREEIQSRIASMTASGYNHIPLGTFFNNGSSLELRTYAAELAGMAAIGVVHAQLADPATAPPAELADYFYAVAKHGLDAAILYYPLRAMKVCALLGMYNIVVKATVALAYVGIVITLYHHRRATSLTMHRTRPESCSQSQTRPEEMSTRLVCKRL
jgi:hypothetical protein